MIKTLLPLLCCLPLLSGCVAAAAVGGATVGGAVLYDKRSFATMNQDTIASRKAQHLIDHSKTLKGRSHIAVSTFNHKLLMIGEAQTPELKDYAYNLIKNNVKHINQIYNQVKIEGAASFSQRADDSWLTTKVKTAMLGAKGLHSTQIKVVTEGGDVYLMGLVSHKQGELAANVARRVSGVRKVIKVFEYT